MAANGTLRLIHTSDIHVGGHITQRPGAQARCLAALSAVVDAANRRQAHLVVFAGDMFDHHRVADEVTDAVSTELAQLQMPAVILPGNHDPCMPAGVWERVRLPAHVHLITDPDGQTVSLPDLDVGVWGRAHISYEHNVAPLRGAPPRSDERWQIAVGHGHLVRDAGDLHRSYLIHPHDIAASGRDYVALGHWDIQQDVSHGGVTAYYGGSPTSTGISSLVELNGSRVRVTPFEI